MSVRKQIIEQIKYHKQHDMEIRGFSVSIELWSHLMQEILDDESVPIQRVMRGPYIEVWDTICFPHPLETTIRPWTDSMVDAFIEPFVMNGYKPGRGL